MKSIQKLKKKNIVLWLRPTTHSPALCIDGSKYIVAHTCTYIEIERSLRSPLLLGDIENVSKAAAAATDDDEQKANKLLYIIFVFVVSVWLHDSTVYEKFVSHSVFVTQTTDEAQHTHTQLEIDYEVRSG